jgi:hypothetical protein
MLSLMPPSFDVGTQAGRSDGAEPRRVLTVASMTARPGSTTTRRTAETGAAAHSFSTRSSRSPAARGQRGAHQVVGGRGVGVRTAGVEKLRLPALVADCREQPHHPVRPGGRPWVCRRCGCRCSESSQLQRRAQHPADCPSPAASLWRAKPNSGPPGRSGRIRGCYCASTPGPIAPHRPAFGAALRRRTISSRSRRADAGPRRPARAQWTWRPTAGPAGNRPPAPPRARHRRCGRRQAQTLLGARLPGRETDARKGTLPGVGDVATGRPSQPSA